MKLYKLIFSIILLTGAAFSAFGQGKTTTLQLSGLIVEGDSSYGIPGAHIVLENAGRGSVSDAVGFFSIPVISGDTIRFSAVGFKTQRLVVPETDQVGLTVLIDMKEEVDVLPVIRILPYPTKELFKEAFLALQLATEEEEQIKENLKGERLSAMASSLAPSASANFRNNYYQQLDYQNNRDFNPTLSLTNPFAWAKFIKSIKDGDFKRTN